MEPREADSEDLQLGLWNILSQDSQPLSPTRFQPAQPALRTLSRCMPSRVVLEHGQRHYGCQKEESDCAHTPLCGELRNALYRIHAEEVQCQIWMFSSVPWQESS